MPESSDWQELCRWEFGVVEEEEEEGDLEFEARDETSSDETRSDITQLDRDNRIILLRAPASSKQILPTRHCNVISINFPQKSNSRDSIGFTLDDLSAWALLKIP